MVGQFNQNDQEDGGWARTKSSSKNGFFAGNDSTSAVPPSGGAVGNALLATTLVSNASGVFGTNDSDGSVLEAGLLAASGVVFMIHPLTSIFMIHMQMATEHSEPILGVISGLGILGLGVAKGIRTARTVGMQ